MLDLEPDDVPSCMLPLSEGALKPRIWSMTATSYESTRVLLVEDDPDLGESLAEVLRAAGYEVDWVTDALSAQAAMLADEHTLVVLDRRLPDRDGLQVLKAVRSAGINTPTLILTARGEIDERIDGLEGGADDYLTKPCDLREFRARLVALERRARVRRRRIITHGPLRLDPAHHRIEADGEAIEVTPSEYELLLLLVEEAGAVVSRRRIVERLYGVDENAPETDAIKVYIHNLRRKLGADRIITVRGVGYAIAQPW